MVYLSCESEFDSRWLHVNLDWAVFPRGFPSHLTIIIRHLDGVIYWLVDLHSTGIHWYQRNCPSITLRGNQFKIKLFTDAFENWAAGVLTLDWLTGIFSKNIWKRCVLILKHIYVFVCKVSLRTLHPITCLIRHKDEWKHKDQKLV